MIQLKLAAIGVGIAILGGVGFGFYHMGAELKRERQVNLTLSEDMGSCKADLRIRTGQLNEAVIATQGWSEKYNHDMEQARNDAAQQYTDQRSRAQASCKASYNAGVAFGRSGSHDAPDGVQPESTDFRSVWLGEADAR